nr:hypothetical protein [Candidatus Sigynarchaeum springense]
MGFKLFSLRCSSNHPAVSDALVKTSSMADSIPMRCKTSTYASRVRVELFVANAWQSGSPGAAPGHICRKKIR